MGILCFGDSNTYGYDPRGFFGDRYAPEDRWVDLLADHTGLECFNQGENGRTIPRNPSGLSPEGVDLLLVMLGTNDLLQGATAVEAARRMEAFLIPLLHRRERIILVAPPPMKRGAWVPTDTLVAASLALAEEYRLVAGKLGIPFVDTRDWGIELAFDGVHFSENGHHTFALRLEQALSFMD
jgi:lysophospholipase L1-like esterase